MERLEDAQSGWNHIQVGIYVAWRISLLNYAPFSGSTPGLETIDMATYSRLWPPKLNVAENLAIRGIIERDEESGIVFVERMYTAFHIGHMRPKKLTVIRNPGKFCYFNETSTQVRDRK